MSTLRKLIKPKEDIIRVVAFMSGTGTNLINIIEHQEKTFNEKNRYLYKVVAILTDNKSSNAKKISEKFNIPVEINDINKFYQIRSTPKKDLSIREEFDRISLSLIEKYSPDLIALAGYMSILTKVIVNRYLTINVHPADLSIKDSAGKRKYIGAHAVKDAIIEGERYLYSSTHIVEELVDNGRLLIISKPIKIILPENFDPSNRNLLKEIEKNHQDRLKELGDWIIYPLTLDYLSLGYFEEDDNSIIHFKGNAIPNGLRL